MLKINDKLPAFEARAFVNGKEKTLKIPADFKGKWLAFVFYPADFTFVCPTELEDLADHYAAFKKEGAEIFSVSTDTVFVHKAWHDHSEAIKKVEYPMLADPSGAICKMFGTYIENPADEDAGLSLRGSFLVDPDGHVKTIEIHANGIGRSAAELLRKLQAAKFVKEHKGQVCPANWKPGEKTLKPGMDLVGKI
ncbi:MAG: redoxin domain-containing protein [Patescibacteria group bacterium]